MNLNSTQRREREKKSPSVGDDSFPEPSDGLVEGGFKLPVYCRNIAQTRDPNRRSSSCELTCKPLSQTKLVWRQLGIRSYLASKWLNSSGTLASHWWYFMYISNIGYNTLFIHSKIGETRLYTETNVTVFTKHWHHTTVPLLCNSIALESN